MTRVLITAFAGYGPWRDNASWLALMRLTHDFPTQPQLTTRRYPVDLPAVRKLLEADLAGDFDYAVHLGQAPGSTAIRLESIGINVFCESNGGAPVARRLVDDGPVAYQTDLPLHRWVECLRKKGLPAQLSHHAGTYLCNATLYLNHYLCARHGWKTQSFFVHLPLEPSQILEEPDRWPSLSADQAAAALRLLLKEMTS